MVKKEETWNGITYKLYWHQCPKCEKIVKDCYSTGDTGYGFWYTIEKCPPFKNMRHKNCCKIKKVI